MNSLLILGSRGCMRWLLRLILFWALMAPISYYFGLPIALEKLSAKAQTQALADCRTKLTTEGLVGSANSPLNPQQGEGYCHCMSDKLVLTKADLLDVVQKKPPAALTAMAQTIADGCNRDLQRSLGFLPAEPAAATPVDAPAESEEMIKL